MMPENSDINNEDAKSQDSRHQDRAHEPMVIDPRMLELLVCPQTRGPLTLDREQRELISQRAGLAYPIRDSIPIMLPEEARTLSDDEREKANR